MASQAVNPDELIGGFRVVDLLDDRGAGNVYRAVKESLDRPMALKLFVGLSENPAFRKRFRQTFTRLAALEHAHVVPVYEAGRSARGLYVVMDLVRGRSLAQLLAAGELEPRDAVALLGPVAEALDAAHALGVLHGDLTPRKILIERGPGRGMLTGFTVRQPPGSRAAEARLKAAAPYVSPEQGAGGPITTRSEVYAFAAIACEALSGAPSFAASGAEGPGATSRRGGLPAAVDDVLQRALAQDASARPPSAGVLIGELRRAFGRDEAEARPATASPRWVALPSQAKLPSVTAEPAAASALPAVSEPRATPSAAAPRSEAAPSASNEDEAESRGRRGVGEHAEAASAPESVERRRRPARSRAAAGARSVLVLVTVALVASAAMLGWSVGGGSGAQVLRRLSEGPVAAGRNATPASVAKAPDGSLRVLGSAMDRLNERRVALERRLRTARTSDGQATAARSLSAAYGAAAAAIDDEAATGDGMLAPALVIELKRTAAAYEAMAFSAARGDSAGFRSAARSARRREDAVRGQLRRSTAPGSFPAEES